MKQKIKLLCLVLIGLFLTSSISVHAETPVVSENVLVKLVHENKSPKPTEFLVYGISEKQYHQALEMKLELSVDKTKKWLKESNLSTLKEFLVSPGIVSEISLPRYNEQRDRMYYILLQKKPDREGIDGEELYQVFPSFISFDELAEDFMMIETKRVFLIQTPYFFKYSFGGKEEPLEGAEFAFYRLNQDNQKEYLVSVDPVDWQTKVESKDAWQFKSTSTGLVSIPDLGLDLGTYYFEETKAPSGYLISEKSKKIPLTIAENEDGLQMSINGEVLVPMQAGELPEETIREGHPRVLNELKKEPPNKNNPPEKKPSSNIKTTKEGFLPKTGEAQWAFSSVGLLLIVTAFIYKKRRKENE